MVMQCTLHLTEEQKSSVHGFYTDSLYDYLSGFSQSQIDHMDDDQLTRLHKVHRAQV